jgi:hypothetical protein
MYTVEIGLEVMLLQGSASVKWREERERVIELKG